MTHFDLEAQQYISSKASRSILGAASLLSAVDLLATQGTIFLINNAAAISVAMAAKLYGKYRKKSVRNRSTIPTANIYYLITNRQSRRAIKNIT